MPELPEVEIVRQNLQDWWVGRTAREVVLGDEALVEDVEPERFVEALKTRVDAVRRRGKYLIVELEGEASLVFHFRMTGKIAPIDGPDQDYVRLAWRVPEVGWLGFVDQRRLGQARLLSDVQLQTWEPLAEMGPEPLGLEAADWKAILPERRMLKTSLLDQSVVAGLGNEAASEIQWRLKVGPRVKVGDLSDAQFEALAEIVPAYLEEIIEAEQGEEVTYMAEDAEANPFQVYGHEGEPCPRCDTPIERVKVGGRSTYYCPNCQGD